MSLPKKRKKLDRNQSGGKEATGRMPTSTQRAIPEGSQDEAEPSSSRNKQMQKAFEVVEHIEHADEIHGVSGLNRDEKTPKSTFQERLGVRLYFHTAPSGGETAPVIEVKFRVPSFFWKVPLIKNLTMNLIRRFTKE